MVRHSSTAKLKNIFSHSELVESRRESLESRLESLCESLESRFESLEFLRDITPPPKPGGLDIRSTGHL